MAMVQRIVRGRLCFMRPERTAARPAKKQQLASEWPLGKLKLSGVVRLKKGTGRGRLKASFSVMFKSDAPIIVSAKSFASRPHLRHANHVIAMIVATVKNSVEPRNEMARMNNVNGGEASV